MPKHFRTLCILLAALAALAMGIAVQQNLLKKPVTPLFASNLKSSSGKLHPVDHLKEKLILLNFWATWCPPCRKEIPDFIRLQQVFKDQGFTVIGIAIDKIEKVRAFEQEVGINYPSLIAEKEGYSLMEEYGSQHGALPYTIILDRQGNIAHKHQKGILSYAEAKQLIEPLL